ncbi:MAG: hypothetical protein VYE15_00405, partial [Myxococcota bacterium]|nr:hypothetical protein [Myxococcota bacterium]
MSIKGLGGWVCALALLTGISACEDAEVTGEGNGAIVPTRPSEQDTSAPALPETRVTTDDVSSGPAPDLPGPMDCEPGTGCMGEPCGGPEDCMSELCVDHMVGRVCSRTCDSECPQGWSCREVTMGGSDVAFVCLSDHANLCRPCTTSGDCISAEGSEDACVVYGTWSGGAGVDAGLEGRFCASSCGADADCPEDFSCREVTNSEGVALVRCVRSEGDCPCSETAIDLGLQTPCERSGEHGVCEGARQCTNTGLTLCDAAEPATELCNGVDDNCDGEVDENTCPSDNPCAMSTCAGAEGCTVELLDGVPCQDASLCMPDALCVAGVCEGDAIDCDDGNPCTDDHCDESLGCVHTYADHPCDDDDPCTLGDTCLDGVCQGDYELDCECQIDAECLPQEDANLCNGTLFCDLSSLPYRCEVNPETVKTCEPLTGPGSQCQEVVCIPGSGVCVTQADNEGGLCDDGNPCTVNATCSNGACDGGESISCDDGNPCTDDSCSPDSGCTHVDNQQPCDDDNVCTVGDLCSQGACQGGDPLACDDGNPCTTSGCLENQGCVQEPIDGPCDDGNSCTTEDSCDGGFCVGAGSLVCDDGNPCTYDVCLLDGGCDHEPKIGACSDGDPCTVGEVCEDGLCTPGTPVDCDDQNPCTDDACGVDGLCVHVGFDGPCDDGNACTYGDQCVGGVCSPEGADSCDDDNPCTTDTCTVGGGCEHSPNSLPCNDLDVCTTVDICAGGTCVGGNTLACDDQNPCTEDLCQPGFGCVHTPTDGDCDDQNPCSVGDQCASGVCMPGSALLCDDTNPCTDDLCEPDTGCTHGVNQAPCDDGSACTINDTCDGGLCQGQLSDACLDYNPCTDDACDDALGCLHTPNSDPCDDLNACTTNDQCVNGFCKPISSVDCNDANGCTDDSCEPDVGCIHTANDAPCDDGDVCTAFDKCADSGCYGGIG